MHRSHLERVVTRPELPKKVGVNYQIDAATYEVTSITPQVAHEKHPERDTFVVGMRLRVCDYHEPTSPAQWQGLDKLARNTRHGKPVKYACHLCKHWLSNPTRIDATPAQEQSTQEQPKQAGLL